MTGLAIGFTLYQLVSLWDQYLYHIPSRCNIALRVPSVLPMMFLGDLLVVARKQYLTQTLNLNCSSLVLNVRTYNFKDDVFISLSSIDPSLI